MEMTIAPEFENKITCYDETEIMFSLNADGELFIAEKYRADPSPASKRFWECMKVNGKEWADCFDENEALTEEVSSLKGIIEGMEEKYLGK